MAVISIKNLDAGNHSGLSHELSSFQDLTESEINATHGGAFWLAAVGAAWLGYRIAKEVKSHL